MILFMVDTPAYINPEEIACIEIQTGPKEWHAGLEEWVENAWWTEVLLKNTERIRISEIKYDFDEATDDFHRIMYLISDATLTSHLDIISTAKLNTFERVYDAPNS